MGMTTFSGPVRSLAGFITGLDAYVPLTVATKTLTPADNGTTTVVNYTGVGGILTLPAASAENLGLTLNVQFAATVNVGGYKIKTITNSPGDLFIGSLYLAASGGAATLMVPNGTVDDVINLNGGVTGGVAGSALTFICTALNRWTVSGNLICIGVPSSPFASS